ncbi:protein kinase domain-containing protein [Methanocaldococcus sp.]
MINLLLNNNILNEINRVAKIIGVLGKGHRGVVLKAIYNNKVVAIKVVRKDSPKNTIEHEAKILKLLERYNIAPKVYYYTKDFVIMDYIDGEELKSAIFKLNKEGVLKVVENILKICLILDRVGVEHGEIQGGRHFLVGRDKVYIIDFDKSRVKKTTKNFTSAIALLFGNNVIANKVKETLNLSEEDIKFLRDLAKIYKKING